MTDRSNGWREVTWLGIIGALAFWVLVTLIAYALVVLALVLLGFEFGVALSIGSFLTLLTALILARLDERRRP